MLTTSMLEHDQTDTCEMGPPLVFSIIEERKRNGKHHVEVVMAIWK